SVLGGALVALLTPFLTEEARAGKGGKGGKGKKKKKDKKPNCTNGQTLCGDQCVDLGTDPNNCGACGTVCSEVEQGTNRQCQRCPDGQTFCPDGFGSRVCTDLGSDQNCGACGRPCPLDETCQSGAGGTGVACVCPGPRCPVGDGTSNCCPVAGGTCCPGGRCC